MAARYAQPTAKISEILYFFFFASGGQFVLPAGSFLQFLLPQSQAAVPYRSVPLTLKYDSTRAAFLQYNEIPVARRLYIVD